MFPPHASGIELEFLETFSYNMDLIKLLFLAHNHKAGKGLFLL
jgi:hypothetical protein